uniref:ubiquitinyl hydrolase 1 n=2 Tax=Babesia bovis TaxID=5865 RepID=S6B396_BABBO|nr:conserved hypothetical protein [Babesia bovis]
METTVYWEKQNPQSKLCALHCLNAFLQGPKVTNEELVGISHRLGKTESELLQQSGKTFFSYDSLGYSYDSNGGDYDVTVLIEALRLRNFHCNYYTLNDMKLSTFQQRNDKCGFICNAHEHWFCVRMLMTDRWFILDSLRPGPQEIDYGSLYSFISTLLENKKGAVFLVSPSIPGMKLPEAEPHLYPKLESHQMFLSLDDIKQLNDQGAHDFQDEEDKSFLYRAGRSKPGPVVWPTTGGVRLDDTSRVPVTTSTPKSDDDYTGSDACRVAVKLSGTARITRSFNPRSSLSELFAWVEKHIDNTGEMFYTLLQTNPNRRLVKYVTGCIELIENEGPPRDGANATLLDAGLESHEMFILRCD